MKNHLDLITVMPWENVTILTGASKVTKARQDKSDTERKNENPFI